MKDRILTDRIAEATVLAGLISNPDRAYEYLGKLSPEHFSDAANRTVFEACQILLTGGREINTISIDEAVRACGASLKQRQSALAALSELPDAVGHSKLEAATGRLNSLLEDRKVLAITSKVNALIEERPGAAREALVNEVLRLLRGDDKHEQNVSLSSLVKPTLEMVNEAMEANARGELPPGTVSTGFKHLDYVCGGFRAGQTVVIGADTGVGKTKTMQQILLNAAINGHPCYHTFLEEIGEEICLKYACAVGGVNVTEALNGTIRNDHAAVRRLLDALAFIEKLPIIISQSSDLASIVANYKRWAMSLPKEGKLPLFALDYVGLVDRLPRLSREESLQEITKTLSQCAVSDKIVFLALTQLNGKHKDRADKRPQRGDSFGSRAVEQFATILAYLHDPTEYFDADPETGEAYRQGYREMIIAKGRFGGRGIVRLHADMATGKITEYDSPRPGPGLIPMAEAIRPGAANQEGGAF